MLRLPILLLACGSLLRAADLAAPAADGWAAQDVGWNLIQATPLAVVVIDGMVPAEVGPNTAILRINGSDVLTHHVIPGTFSLRTILVGKIGAKHAIALHWSHATGLPAPDGRVVACSVNRVAIEPIQVEPSDWTAPTDLVTSTGPVALGQGWGQLETYQGETFRWIADKAEIAIIPGMAATLSISAEPGPSLMGQPCNLRLSDRTGSLIDKLTLTKRGSYDLIIPAQSIDALPLTLTVINPTKAVPGDGRTLSLRILKIMVQR